MSEPCFAEMLEDSFGTPYRVSTAAGRFMVSADFNGTLDYIRQLGPEHNGVVIIERKPSAKATCMVKDGGGFRRPRHLELMNGASLIGRNDIAKVLANQGLRANPA